MAILDHCMRAAQKPQKRRVFFSFHYQRDVWRANQVRQSWRFREGNKNDEGFFDASLWEKSKRKGDEAIKSLIRDGIRDTSVTCVLAGRYTYQRRWVRYEIARSIVKRNGLLTVHIHKLKDADGRTSGPGPDPLEWMGIFRAENGSLYLAEKHPSGKWVQYSDYTRAIQLPAGWEEPGGYVMRLSRYASRYDYVDNNGYKNLATWIHKAAADAGR